MSSQSSGIDTQDVNNFLKGVAIPLEIADLPTLADRAMELYRATTGGDVSGFPSGLSKSLEVFCPFCGLWPDGTAITYIAVRQATRDTPGLQPVAGGPNMAAILNGKCPTCGGKGVIAVLTPALLLDLPRKCFFCRGDHPHDMDATGENPQVELLGKAYRVLPYSASKCTPPRRVSVTVPRCIECRMQHRAQRRALWKVFGAITAFSFGLVGAVVGLIVGFKLEADREVLPVLAAAGAFLFAACVVARFYRNRVYATTKALDEADGYTTVQQMLKQGWLPAWDLTSERTAHSRAAEWSTGAIIKGQQKGFW